MNAEIQPATVSASTPATQPSPGRSKPGVASFLFALGGLALLLALWATGALIEGRFDDTVRYEAIEGLSRMTSREEFDFLLAAFGGLGVMTLCLAGLALGIAGALQKGRRRLFAVLGIVFNGVLLPLVAIPWALFVLLWLLKPLAWH